MKLLFSYLKQYRWLVFLALLLATINQVFSLLDPLILRKIIDEYTTAAVTKKLNITSPEFFKGAGTLILLAMVSELGFVRLTDLRIPIFKISLFTQSD